MPTTVVKTIGTGGDYSTLQAWEDACPANLVTADQIWQGQCKNQEFALNATILNISGTTTDATHYIELTTEAGASFRDHASKATNALRYDATKGASIRATNAYGKPIWVQVPYTRISNLQVQNHSASNNAALLVDVLNCLIRDSIFEGWSTPIFTGDLCTLVNVVAIKKAAGGNIIGATYGLNAYNCTLIVPSDVAPATNGISGAYGGKTANLKNTAIFGATTAVNLAATKVITTCVTDQAAPLGGFTTQSYASCFENSTNAATDLRVKSNSPLINTGTTDATYGINDIIGTARSSFDIGAWEYVASGNAAPTFNSGTPIGAQSGVVGVALTSNNIASKFSDSDALTFTKGGTWPAGVTLSSVGVISGTPTTVETRSGLTVIATDTAAQTVSSDTFTFTISTTADTTVPTQTGTISISNKTTTSYTATWPAGADNVAVTGYQYRINAGAWQTLGNVLTIGITGRTPGATDTFEVRAFDAAANYSTPALSIGVTLNTASGAFTSKPLANNTGVAGIRASVAVYWEWRAGVGVGTAPTSVVYGSGTTGSDGRLVITTGLPQGAGVLQVETTDRLHTFTQRGTVT